MAAEMRPTTSQLSSRNPDTTYRKKPLDFKAAGQVVTATTGSRVAPRQYIKTLHTVITTLEKYRAKLSPELLKALKVYFIAAACVVVCAVQQDQHSSVLLIS